MSEGIYNVLFLCTGNSARSIIAEVVLNELGAGRFKAYSAGSHPRGAVHPITLEVLQAQGYDTSSLRSKSWDEFARPDAPVMDFVFTVCDQAAGEVCPVWPGQPITAHWGFADPVKVEGSHEQRLKSFSHAQNQIVNRIRLFLSLPIGKLDRLALKREVDQIGKTRDGGEI
ncbi:MAG: arsenate reductase ArsC [Proteobacteria bacterium]|nr:arsenate reductase ArsC [Pseudomonadota bacterium]